MTNYTHRKKISVISVCFNEKQNILPMYERVTKVFSNLKNYDFELIYVDNCSEDNSEEVLRNLAKKDPKVKVILMARNNGSSQYSNLAGLRLAIGDAAVLIDGDMQDPPELIPEFIKKWEEGYDVVYGVRKSRKGSLLRRFFYKLFYRLFKALSYINIPLDAGDFSLLDRKIINIMTKYQERDYYIRGLRAFTGFNQIGVEYIRDERRYGKTVTTISSYFWYAKKLIVNFSFRPLEWISKIAFLFMLAAFGLLVYEIVFYFIDSNIPKGTPTIIILVLFTGAIQLLCISIIAEYLANMLVEIKDRPRYIVKEIINDQGALEKISE